MIECSTPPSSLRNRSISSDFSADGANRRVIFPTLHHDLSSESPREEKLRRHKSDPPPSPSSVSRQQKHNVQLQHTTTSSDDRRPRHNRELDSILSLGPLQPREVSAKQESSTPTTSPPRRQIAILPNKMKTLRRRPEDLSSSKARSEPSSSIKIDSLVIPPFKGSSKQEEEPHFSEPLPAETTPPRFQHQYRYAELDPRPLAETGKLPSILRSAKRARTTQQDQTAAVLTTATSKSVSSVPSPVVKAATEELPPPPLVAVKEDEDSQSSAETEEETTSSVTLPPRSPSRLDSTSPSPPAIAFDPRVWVVEFERTEEERKQTWFTPEEMEQFKREALARVMRCRESTELVPTGTGRTVQRRPISSKAIYSLKALTLDGENECDEDDAVLEAEAREQIQNILVVDPEEVLLGLFTKSLTRMLPHVKVTTAISSTEALQRIQEGPAKGFDIIIVEERLRCGHHRQKNMNKKASSSLHFTSGSEFIKFLSSKGTGSPKHEPCLLIGASPFIKNDRAALEKSGSDLVWALPPPLMDEDLRNELLRLLIDKRSIQKAPAAVIRKEARGKLPQAA